VAARSNLPENTKESHEAGSRMGAGIQECDVTFTKDGQLVCRHDQCDLHTTTNILVTPLAAQCTRQFTPAQFDSTGKLVTPASAMGCSSEEHGETVGESEAPQLRQAVTALAEPLGEDPDEDDEDKVYTLEIRDGELVERTVSHGDGAWQCAKSARRRRARRSLPAPTIFGARADP